MVDYDPDLVKTSGGDIDLVMKKRSDEITLAQKERRRPVNPKRLLAEFNEHQKLIVALQKLNFAKGIADQDSSLGMIPMEDFIYEQIKTVNFIYSNIVTRFFQDKKRSTSIPMAISDKRKSGGDSLSEIEGDSKKKKSGKNKKGKKSKKAKKSKMKKQ